MQTCILKINKFRICKKRNNKILKNNFKTFCYSTVFATKIMIYNMIRKKMFFHQIHGQNNYKNRDRRIVLATIISF